MRTILFLSIIYMLITSSFYPHPIYVSNTEIDYKAKDKKIEIAIKIFSDDLQDAVSFMKKTTIEIGTDKEHDLATEYILDYLREHFILEINGKKRNYEFVNRKLIKKDFFAMWVLLEINKINKLKSLELTNDILIDLHTSQQNIITFRKDDIGYKKYTTYNNNTSVKLY